MLLYCKCLECPSMFVCLCLFACVCARVRTSACLSMHACMLVRTSMCASTTVQQRTRTNQEGQPSTACARVRKCGCSLASVQARLVLKCARAQANAQMQACTNVDNAHQKHAGGASQCSIALVQKPVYKTCTLSASAQRCGCILVSTQRTKPEAYLPGTQTQAIPNLHHLHPQEGGQHPHSGNSYGPLQSNPEPEAARPRTWDFVD